MIGKVLDGRYRILSLLGEGGMGQVFLAEHTLLGKKVAVKVLHEHYSRHEEVVKRFQQEAIAASRIGQENIVDVTDFGRTGEGALYFVMEQLDGVSLAQIIRTEGPLSPERGLAILAQVCKALAAAHGCGIIHRDLKPENVVVVQRPDRPDFVKVLDFGISKVATGDVGQAERLTRVGMIMGTPEYMAPEQASGDVIDHRADIYALGVMSYELFTGELPFVADNPLSVLMKHQTETPEPLRTRRPDLDIPEDVEAIVLRALEKDPSGRQPSMMAVLRELSQCLERRGLRPFAMSLPPSIRGEVITPGGGVPPPVPASNLPGDPNRPTRPLEAMPVSVSPAPVVAPPVDAFARTVLSPAGGTHAPRSRAPLYAGLAVGVVIVAAGLGLLLTRTSDADPGGAVGPASIAEANSKASEPAQSRAPLAPEAAPSGTPVPPAPGAPAPSATPAPHVVAAASTTAAVATVSLDTIPSGAVVYEGTLRLGVTPLQLTLKEGTAATYRLALDGYQPATRTIESRDGEVKVRLTRIERGGKRTRTGLKENPYEDLKANPF